MGFMDKIKSALNVPEDDYYDDIADDIAFNDKKKQTQPVQEDYTASGSDSSNSSYSTDKRNKVVNIHATTQLQVVLVKPERFDDAPSIANHLNDKRTVVLNLEAASKEVSRRLIDFLSGVAYANSGQIKRVANSTFIITPYNVDIMGDMLIDELENSGLYI